MRNFSKCFAQLLKKFDLFPASQYLRYKQEPEYKTATGGCVSIAVIIIFVILFYTFALETINKKIIKGSVSYTMQVEPSQLEITFKPSPQFMFVVGMPGFNLSDTTKKYFNVTLAQNKYEPNFQNPKQTVIPMVSCTPQHFSHNGEVLDTYNKFQLSISLCPPFDYPFNFKGRVISPQYTTVSVYVGYCNQTIDPKCANDSEIAAIQQKMGGYFTIGLILINTIVNPESEQYMQTYVEDQNYYYFTTKTGYQITAQIEEMEINTDQSLLPTTNIVTQKIVAITSPPRVRQKETINNRYIQFVLNKASTSTVYSRSFSKIDDYFSYVGGLVGTIILFFFILSNYSEKSYVINVASDIYSSSDDENQSPKSFNFFYYFCMIVKGFCQSICLKFPWKQPDRFTNIMQEMEKQLNITYLIKRLNLFQSALSSILAQHQFKTILLNQQKKTIQEAALVRKKSKRLLRAQTKNQQNKQNESSINNLADSNLQQNGQIKQPLQVQLRQQQDSQSNSSNTFKQGSQTNVKENVIQVINQSREGNPISRRIMKKLNRKIFPQLNIPIQDEIVVVQQNGSYNELQVQKQDSGEKEIKEYEHFNFQLS